MGKIICLMGKSSAGKDTIFKKILEKNVFKLKTVVPYTTRPIREGEQNGVEYYFTDEKQYEKIKASGKIIEERSYNTVHGIWRYFTVDDGNINLATDNYIMIGTLEVYGKLKEYFGKEQIIPIMIELEDGERLQRALDREKKPENRRYEEMCRRFLADSADFSEEKIKKAQIDKRFVNNEITKCLEEIIAYLEQSIN